MRQHQTSPGLRLGLTTLPFSSPIPARHWVENVCLSPSPLLPFLTSQRPSRGPVPTLRFQISFHHSATVTLPRERLPLSPLNSPLPYRIMDRNSIKVGQSPQRSREVETNPDTFMGLGNGDHALMSGFLLWPVSTQGVCRRGRRGRAGLTPSASSHSSLASAACLFSLLPARVSHSIACNSLRNVLLTSSCPLHLSLAPEKC